MAHKESSSCLCPSDVWPLGRCLATRKRMDRLLVKTAVAFCLRTRNGVTRILDKVRKTEKQNSVCLRVRHSDLAQQSILADSTPRQYATNSLQRRRKIHSSNISSLQKRKKKKANLKDELLLKTKTCGRSSQRA
ncbi:hypothetical protein CEXT_797181 [Caerostris extrusa]|uniref:Uncharacterized protein n=1 Tax=Caerostris extrusa TaxID=172846 RepID=A0AAV4RE95_CAEEX|nr:hypothetical protein CEXT_797181 [Caerostris extrusa]